MHIASGTIPVSYVDVPRLQITLEARTVRSTLCCGLRVTINKLHYSVCVPTRLLRLAKQGLGPESCGDLSPYTELHILVYTGTYIQEEFERLTHFQFSQSDVSSSVRVQNA